MPTKPPPDPLRNVMTYPLFDALYGRRTRRFGLGFEMDEGPFPYKSARAPLPLSETEEALLVAAGIGFSGMALWDQTRPVPYRSGDGRTFPSTSRGRRTTLFFTNDSGVYVIDPDRGSSDGLRTTGTAEDPTALLALYRDCRRKLRSGRLDLPRRIPPLCGHNLWASNQPGSTLFMPICDVSLSLITLIAHFVDRNLERFVARDGRGMNIVDDRHGFRPAGTERWLRNGFLDEAAVLPLSAVERQATYFMFSEPASICQNIFLATEPMGLGGYKHCSFLSREIFETLGFTMVVPHGAPMLAHPVGLAGVLQAYCPPWFASMDAAVEAALAPMRGPPSGGRSGPPAPWKISNEAHLAGSVRISDEGVACVKAICDYIVETYGRFPGAVDAMHLMWLMQVHHLDTEFYDRFYREGAYGSTHATHMADWHGPET